MEIARTAARVNERMENIGARRLHTIMETLLEELSFNAPERQAKALLIDGDFVRERLNKIADNEDLSRYIL
jgi:ATP-dependent HslUV protease ATP-binding subunit HslU